MPFLNYFSSFFDFIVVYFKKTCIFEYRKELTTIINIKTMSTTILKKRVLAELLRMGNTEKEAEKLIEIHFNNALYLKKSREIALYMTA